MLVQINTDRNIEGNTELSDQIQGIIDNTLGRFESYVTRIEIHLSDENAGKSGSNDKRCAMEARMEGRDPVAVTENADDVLTAVTGAANKLKASLDSTIGKLRDTQRR